MKPVEVEFLMKGNLDKGLDSATTKAELLDASFKRVGMTIGGIFTAQKAMEFVKTMIDVRQEVESLEISFTTLLGSKDKAAAFFGEIKQYAVDTPLMLNDLAGGAQTMLGFNIEAEKVIPTLKQIGDITMGDSERFKSLTLAFSQMSATGKLMGQDLLQMINAGFNPLTYISERTGKSISQLKDEMSAGAISADMVAQAFADATAEGGKFHGMLEKQSKGLKGQISNFEGAVDDMFNALGEKSEGVLAGSIGVATSLVKNYEDVGKALMSLVAVYGTYKAAVIASMVVQKSAALVENIRLVMMFRKEIGLMTAAQQAFNITANANPYILLTTVILSLASAVAIYSKNCSATADETQRVTEREKEQTDALEDKKTKIEECIASIEDENAAQQDKQAALESLKKLMPSVFSQYKTEKDLIDHLTEARVAYNNALREEKNLKGEGNLKADQQRLADLKQYQKLREKYYKTGRIEMTDDEYNTYMNLDKKYKAEIQKSRGTLQTFNSAITEMIKATEGTIWKDIQLVRTDNHNKFMASINTMSVSEAKQIISLYQRSIEKAQKEGKKLVQLSGESVATTIPELQNRIKAVTDRMKSIQENASKDYLNDAKKEWEKAQKEVNNVIANRNNRDLYPDEGSYMAALRNAREAEKKAKAQYEATGGDTSPKRTSGTTPEEKANIQRAEQEERQRQIEDNTRRQQALERQAAFDIRQASIEGYEEGFQKELETINLNYDKLIEANRQREQEWVAELQKISDLSFEKEHPDWKKQGLTRPTVIANDLSEDQKNYLKQYTEAANSYQQAATAKLYKDLLDKYQNFEQQRTAVMKKFAKDREQIQAATDEDGNPLSDEIKNTALAELDRQEREALKQINDAQLSSIEKDNNLLVALFSDTSQKSIAEIQKIIDKVKLLMEYMEAEKNSQGDAVIKDKSGNVKRTISKKQVLDLGFSSNDLKTLSQSPEKLKALQEAFAKLKKELSGKDPLASFVDNLDDAIKKIKDGKIGEGITGIGESILNLTPMLNDFAGKISQIFDNGSNEGGGFSDNLQTITGILGGVGQTVAGVGQIMSGDIMGGIQSAISGVSSLFSMANAAAERHRKALEAIMNEKIAQQREYNLLLLEQNLEYEKATTIFGTDSYAKAINAVKVMKEAYADLNSEIQGTNEQQRKFAYKNVQSPWLSRIYNASYTALKDAYSGLADIEIKTGHKKTGLFGWGKGKDIFSSILDVYPELLDNAGNFNRELAESIINSREFADNDKEALQNIIDLYDKAEEAWQEVKDYFTDIFGDLGGTISDALADAFRNGTDAAENFVDSVTGMLEDLAEQMVYTVTIAPYLEKAQNDMLDIMKNENMSDEDKFNNYVNILDAMMDNVLGQQGTYNSLLSQYRQMAENKGLDLWAKDDGGTTQTGKSGAYEVTASQESVTRLEGLFSSLLEHDISIDENVFGISENLGIALDHLKKISESSSKSEEHLSNIEKSISEMKSDISTIKRDGVKTR